MVTMCANTGTYIDMPFHRFADGHDLTGLALERVSQVPALCIDCTGMRSIGPDVLDGLDLRDRAVLFHTGHSATFGTDAYFQAHPFLSPAAASALVDAGASVVGIDAQPRRRWSSRAHRAAGCTDPHRRAPHEPRRAACRRVRVHRRPAQDRRARHVHRSGPRRRRLMRRSLPSAR